MAHESLLSGDRSERFAPFPTRTATETAPADVWRPRRAYRRRRLNRSSADGYTAGAGHGALSPFLP
jgi:hypothetical protein